MKAWSILRQPRWLLLVLVTVLLAGYWLFVDEPAVEEIEILSPASPPVTIQPLASASDGVSGEAPGEAASTPADAAPVAAAQPPAGPIDIFAVRTWEPPPPPPEAVVDAPPPPPQAPPVPFRFIGKLEERGKPAVYFLAEGEQILVVSPGDLIKGNYRVGKIEGGELHFFYRPMKLNQSIPAGGDT